MSPRTWWGEAPERGSKLNPGLKRSNSDFVRRSVALPSRACVWPKPAENKRPAPVAPTKDQSPPQSHGKSWDRLGNFSALQVIDEAHPLP